MFEETLSWVDNELKENRNDTIHDFLSYLAEQMIELNKKKQIEINGFLQYLEREIKVKKEINGKIEIGKIDDLQNKSFFKEYYKLNFNDFIEILKKNGKKLSINPSNREFQENLKKEYDKSVAILLPLIDKIQKTDNLIDNIVYKLYGLTKEEFEIVEGSLGKEEKEIEEIEEE